MLAPLFKAFSDLITYPFAVRPSTADATLSHPPASTVHDLVSLSHSHSHCTSCQIPHHIYPTTTPSWHPDLIITDSSDSEDSRPRYLSDGIPLDSYRSYADIFRCPSEPRPIRPFPGTSSTQRPKRKKPTTRPSKKERCARCAELEVELDDLRKQVWALSTEVASVRDSSAHPILNTSLPSRSGALAAAPSRTPAKRPRDDSEEENDTTMLWAPKKKTAWSRSHSHSYSYPVSPDSTASLSTPSHSIADDDDEPISPIVWDQDGTSEGRLSIPRSPAKMRRRSKQRQPSVVVAEPGWSPSLASLSPSLSPSPYRSAAMLYVSLPPSEEDMMQGDMVRGGVEGDVFGPTILGEGRGGEVDQFVEETVSALWST